MDENENSEQYEEEENFDSKWKLNYAIRESQEEAFLNRLNYFIHQRLLL